VAAFVKEAAAHEAFMRHQRGAQRVLVSSDGGPQVAMTLREPPRGWALDAAARHLTLAVGVRAAR